LPSYTGSMTIPASEPVSRMASISGGIGSARYL
jgi:hypothetical protein